MKRNIIFCLFVILLYTIFAYAQDVSSPGLEMRNFKFGILSQDSNGEFYVSKETNVIPKEEGLKYGFTFDYVRIKDSPVRERVTLQGASTATVLGSTEDENILSTDELGTIVLSSKLIKEESGAWSCALSINKFDNPANYVITIEHDKAIVKRVKYTIKKVKEED